MKTVIARHNAQQGDVLLRKNKISLAGAKLVSKRHMVLAKGSSTGHSHSVTEPSSKMVEQNGIMYLVLAKNATIKHQEHKPITLEKGTWEIGHVQEFDYFSKMIRKVVD